MNLSISNIAWIKENDAAIYAIMRDYDFTGLEIAPTRVFTNEPYNNLEFAKGWADNLKTQYDFSIPSMQSIWYGRSEKLFGSEEERAVLLDYTKKAVNFAEAVGCKNLVFGCPKSRALPENLGEKDCEAAAVHFFRSIGDYAASRNAVIGMEANPKIYGTNFINTTEEALSLIEAVCSDGFKLNLDVGAMIQNCENVDLLCGKVSAISHVHISEPNLAPIQRRDLHKELLTLLKAERYEGWISIEMGATDVRTIENCMDYVKEIAE